MPLSVESKPARKLSGWRLAFFVTLIILLFLAVGYVPFALMVGWNWPLAFVWHLPKSFFVGYDHGKAAMGVMRAIGNFALIWLAYAVSRSVTAESIARLRTRVTRLTKIWCYLACVLIAMSLAAGFREAHGSHVEGGDPLRGGGEIVMDFEPTDEERAQYGAEVFFQLLIPGIFGVARGLDKARNLRDRTSR